MKAMLWKEFRENFKWAVLAMIGLGLAEFYGLYYIDHLNPNNQGVTLCNPTFLMATTFGCATVGLLLGLLQILPEQRRDQWAALLHRPVTRDTIFRGKVLAGVVLYLLATIPPFAACVWMAATPGHFVAPFVPGLILPGLADTCAGLVYYFAALLLALQPGPWFGARILAPFAAVHLSFFVTSANYFYVAVEATALMALVLFIAAWGAMRSNGPFSMRPWLGKFALLAAVFYGLCGVGGLVTMLSKAGRQDNYIGSEYRVTADGQPIITTTNANLSTEVTDLAGNIINDERYKGRASYENFLYLMEVSSVIGDSHGYDPVQQYYRYRQSYLHVSEVELAGYFPLPVSWFYLDEPKYFVGISKLNRQPVGIADTSGFKPPQAQPAPFAHIEGFINAYEGAPCLVADGNLVFAFDFEHEKMFEIPGADKVYGTRLVSYKASQSASYDEMIALAHLHELQVYDLKGNPIATLPYHRNTDRFGAISLGVKTDRTGYFVRYSPSFWISGPERNRMPSFLEEVDAQGNILHAYDLPPLPIHLAGRTWVDYLSKRAQTPVFIFGNLIYAKVGALCGSKHLANVLNLAFGQGWQYTKETCIFSTVASLVFAMLTLAWARWMHSPWKRAWLWALFVFGFNLAGLIVFRLCADWPVRVKCPSCGRKRPVDFEKCPACGAAWPEPAREGIEIFTPVESARAADAVPSA